MKKVAIILALMVLLTGCSMETFEKVEDENLQVVLQPQKQLQIDTEEGALLLDNGQARLYLCDGYEISVQILPSGDVSATVKELTGFEASDLTVLQTKDNGMNRFECVWTSAGLYGDTAGRLVIFDDGCYHYAISILSAAEDAYALQTCWNQIIDSVTIS